MDSAGVSREQEGAEGLRCWEECLCFWMSVGSSFLTLRLGSVTHTTVSFPELSVLGDR